MNGIGTLHLASWSVQAEQAAETLQVLVGTLMPDAGTWLVLEQMHTFNFDGPNRADVVARLGAALIGTFGLRGRAFSPLTQIQWRRFDDSTVRIVAASESPLPSTVPAVPEPMKQDVWRVEWAADRRLILWGRSESLGPYRELRVAGHDKVDYPGALASRASESVLPVLLARVYTGLEEGREVFWRLLSARPCRESEVRGG